MKSYKEIRTDIEKAFDTLDKVREEEKRLTTIWTEEEDLVTRRDKRRSVLDDIADCNSKELALQMSIHIMKNNARVALWREVLPVVLEVLKKYEGKPAIFGGTYTKADENEMHHCYQVMHDLCEDLRLI